LLSHLPASVGQVGVKVRDVIRLIEADGWRFERQRGSHRIYRHPEKSGTVTVAGQRGKDMPIGTLENIIWQAKLKGRGR
jgi:predicted RNA binding protein YcfA (HicA-like mRNA interferase family)